MAKAEGVAVVSVAGEAPRLRGWIAVLAAAGLGLGVVAFLGDLVPGTLGQVLLALTSNGMIWGLGSALAGAFSHRRVVAVAGGAGLMVLAVLTYYALILLVSRRWQLGSVAPGGESGSSFESGLLSVARALVFWLLVAVIGGPFLGILGHAITHAAPVRSAVAGGTLLGGLAGEGIHNLIFVHWWRLDEFGWSVMLASITQASLGLVAAIALFARGGGIRRWSVFAVSSFGACIVSVVLWHQIEVVRVSVL